MDFLWAIMRGLLLSWFDLTLILATVSKLWRWSGRAVSMLYWGLKDLYSGAAGAGRWLAIGSALSSHVELLHHTGHTIRCLHYHYASTN